MIRILLSNNQKRSYFFIGVTWILAWVIPWGNLPSIQEGNFLAYLADMIRLGVALFIFIFPGALLYILLRREEEIGPHQLGIISIGFTFSVFLVALIGFAGRVLGLSFIVVKSIFALIGLVELFLLALFKPNYVVDIKFLIGSLNSVLRNPPLIFALILTTIMTFNDNLFFIDDTIYLAYLTNWQHATELGFNTIIHEINSVEYIRFWLAMYPMGQALLADLSGLPGILLLGNYLEFFLVPLAVVTSYWFARVLGLSRKAAGFAVLIQITLYVWMMGDHFPVGMWFYQSLAEDKVTTVFILAPVFFVFGLDLLQNPSRGNWLLFLGSGLSLTFTHPVILFFASSIILCITIIAFVVKMTGWRFVFQLIIAIAGIMLPYLIIRILDNPAQVNIPFDAVSASESFQIERYTRVVNDIYYGLNPGVMKFLDFELEDGGLNNVLQAFRYIPIIIVMSAAGIALININKGPLYWYILSSILLIAFATLPYTGWILGYFVSARLISRSSWFSPLGLSSVLILMYLASWLKTSSASFPIKITRLLSDLRGTTLGLTACFIFASPLLMYYFLPRIPAYFEVLDHNKQLARVGAYIDRNSHGPVTAIALDYDDTQLLPGVSSNTRLISFREETDFNGFNSSLTIVEIHDRIYGSSLIRSIEDNTSDVERCDYIKKFGLKFVVAEYDTATIFAAKLKNCNLVAETVLKTKDLLLLEIN